MGRTRRRHHRWLGPRQQIWISEPEHQLLKYIVAYLRLRGYVASRQVVDKLIVAYGKQLVTGMPEPAWRATMLDLINKCEVPYRRRGKHGTSQEHTN